MSKKQITRELIKAKGLCLSDSRVEQLAYGISNLVDKLYDADTAGRETILAKMEDDIIRMAPRTLLVTGGAGFIGSNFVKHMLREHNDCHIIVLDKLTYTGNLNNLTEVAGNTRYTFVKGDVTDSETVDQVVSKASIVVNFAAESRIDRSMIYGFAGFMNTNLQGTFVLLEAAKKHNIELFMQISNASVYGSIEVGSAKETEPLRPSGCYSMSKAAADQLALRYSQFHSLPVIISRTANVYGPNQDVQKVIPQFITAALEDGKVEIYGNGSQIRDLVYVDDVCQALDLLIEKGTEGEIYNIGTGGPGERTTLQVCQKILEMMGKSADLIQYIHDRPMHDFRWSMDTSKIRELGWVPLVSFEDGLNRTVRWYICNKRWWQGMRKQAYSEFETEEKTFSIPRLASTSGRSLHTIQA